jgi:glucose-1-phosphate adenylyltransferase
MKKMMAMILAGGKGKRMDILCCERPKPTLPFAGGLRVIDFTLSNCVHSGITNFAALVDYQRHSMADYLRQWALTNAYRSVFYILEPNNGSYKGTADAVYQHLDYLKRYNPEAVLVLAGDHIYRMDYRKMLAFHEQVGADVTVGVVSVPIEEAHRFGIVTIDSDHRIIDFVEKPIAPPSNLVSMGIYIFNPHMLAEYLIEDSTHKDSPHDFGRVIIPKMVRRNRVFAYQFNGYWQDIGSVEAYYETNMEVIGEPPSLTLDGSWPILTKSNSTLHSEPPQRDCIKRNIISAGCVIKGDVENSILSPGVVIKEHAMVRNSVLMANTTIDSYSMVNHSILDEGVEVGKFCHIGFGTKSIVKNGNITVVGKEAKIQPYSIIYPERNASVNTETRDFIANGINPRSAVLQT